MIDGKRAPTDVPMCDVLCVGLVCVDLILAVPTHPGPDEKIRATSRLVAPGGPAAVAAAQIARLGGRSAFAGLVGDPARDPFASLLRDAFAAEGIDHEALLAVPDFETPLAAVLVKPNATRSVISHRPAPGEIVTNLVTISALRPALPSAQVLLTDGHRPEWREAILHQSQQSAAPLVLDAGSWSDSVRALAPHADHLVASEACARSALGGSDPASASPVALRAALRAAPSATVVVTLGSRGVVWHSPEDDPRALRHLPAPPIEAIDSTGAGDAFHGAYALGLARGLGLPEILRLASAAGALACTRPGAWPALARAAEIHSLAALPL